VETVNPHKCHAGGGTVCSVALYDLEESLQNEVCVYTYFKGRMLSPFKKCVLTRAKRSSESRTKTSQIFIITVVALSSLIGFIIVIPSVVILFKKCNKTRTYLSVEYKKSEL